MGAKCSRCTPKAVKEVFKRILFGQAVAFLNSLTGVFTTELVNNNASYPVLQSVTSYTYIFTVYMPLYLILLYKYRKKKFSNFSFLQYWWKYIILAFVDLEANYCAVLAYQYTDMLSVQLLNCFTIPCVLILSFFLLKMKFAMTHILGCIIAVGGMALLIGLDANGISRSDKGSKPVLGDILALICAALYGLSNVLTEWFVRPKKSKGITQYPNAAIEEYEQEQEQGLNDNLEEEPVADKNKNLKADEQAFELTNAEELQSESSVESTAKPGEANGEMETASRRNSENLKANFTTPTDNCYVEGEDVGAEEEMEELPRAPVYLAVVEYLAMMPMFAAVLAVCQFFVIEWKTFKVERKNWTNMDWLFQMMFGLTMLLLYTSMPALFIISSAAFANISLLAMNIYSIIWNVAFFKIYPTRLFFAAYVIIIVGTIVFNLSDVFRIPFCTRFNYPCGKPSTVS